MEYILTRYLYGRDEVEASLITSLLTREDVCECYFWAYELFYSGFDITRIVWNIYYDFYFEHSPQLEPYIHKKFAKMKASKGQDGDVDALAFVIRNLFRGKPSSKVFVLRQFIASDSAKTLIPSLGRKYRGRKPKWCQNHDVKYHQWLLSICKHDYVNIAYHTYDLSEQISVDLLFDELVNYFRPYYHIKDSIHDYWHNRSYEDDTHFLLSMIVHLCDFRASVSNSTHMVAPKEEDLQWIRDTCYDGLVSKMKAYRVLFVARKYNIRNDIGCFVLAREGIKDLQNILMCWENYAYDTPLWLERFKRYGGTLNKIEGETTRRITFDDDSSLETFYDTYGLELDEQSKCTQDKSIASIPIVPWISWHDALFQEKCLIPLNEDFRFEFT